MDETQFSTGESIPRNPYVTVAFGYKGLTGATIATKLNERISPAPADKLLLPDFVFVADPGYVILRIKGMLETTFAWSLPGHDYTSYAFLPTGTDTLPLFFFTLNLCLGQVRLRGLDYTTLWLNLSQAIYASITQDSQGT